MYEKKKIMENITGGEEDTTTNPCFLCDRAKSVVYCLNLECRHTLTNIRVRKTCPVHPKNFFTMDLANCPKCKGHNLAEVGVDPVPPEFVRQREPHVQNLNNNNNNNNVIIIKPTPPGLTQSVTIKSRLQNYTVAPGPSSSPGSRGRGKSFFGQQQFQALDPEENDDQKMESADETDDDIFTERYSSKAVPLSVRQPMAQMTSCATSATPLSKPAVQTPLVVTTSKTGQQTAPAPDLRVHGATGQTPVMSLEPSTESLCHCKKSVTYVLCSMCGYYGTGVRKYVECRVHPQGKNGIKQCPDCDAPSHCLDEG